MRAGPMRHQITLQQLSGAVDELNQPIPDDWADVVAGIYADIRYLSGLETVKSDAPVGVSRCSIRIRWRAGVTVGMRVLHDGTVFDVKSVLPDPTGKRHIDMVAETGMSNG